MRDAKREVALLLLVATLLAGQTYCADEPQHRLIVGWDDAVICCGPGTEAGMDSPAAIERMVKRWKARGYRGVYWRVDEAMLPERFMTRWQTRTVPAQNYLLARVDQTLHTFPVLSTLLAASEREGLQIWAWYPTVYSNGAPSTGPGFTHAWLYENRFGTDHPEVLTIDRAGNKQYMVWEYAYPEARRQKVAEFVQFAKDFGFRRFVACLRTEAAQMQPAPTHADQFGFNAPVVDDMQRRYGIDILADPRFDYTDPRFDVHDPILENWRTLRGEYLTQFYRELRTALNAIDPGIQIAVQIPGDRAGTCLGNWPLDWRTWIDEGLVNEIVVPVVLDGYEGYGPRANFADFGYLEANVTADTVHAFVQHSRQPTARVIQAGGPATTPESPPHADGWRLDSWPDLWWWNMAERWEQWQRDVAEFGHIRFIEQSFDDFPEGSDGFGGAYGDYCHRPDLRCGPGFWEVLGDGRDAQPHAQSSVRRGTSGRAIKLTRHPTGDTVLSARHHSRHDRGNYPFPGDTAVCSGACQLDFWLYRADASSALVAYLQYDIETASRYNVGVYVPPGEASTVCFSDAGKLVPSSATMSVGSWHRVSLRVDLQRHSYSVDVAAEGKAEQLVCRDVRYATTHNAFNRLEFAPQGETGNVLYLDDVSLCWTPAVMFEPRGTEVLASDGFESPCAGTSIDGQYLPHGLDWTVGEGCASDIVVDHDISFGREYQSLRFRGAGGRTTLQAPTLKWSDRERLVIDVDVFLKSDQFHTQVTPSPDSTGSDDVGLALVADDLSRPLVQLSTRGGSWQLGSGGTLTDLHLPAAFDAWNHLQVVCDPRTKLYCVLLQVVGEPPRELGRGVLDAVPPANTRLTLELWCFRPQPRADGPAFDNLFISR